ncbi:MAG: DUF501 domain-containing protein [Synergistaceae bacterium]|nr:DUF501 domain-containing protein [Synergistaceae bacterium]
MKLNIDSENETFDYFAITERDSKIIQEQMKGRKFNSCLLLGVTSRCLYGKPQVILCKSLLNGIPFPNNFWLSCPVLVKIASRLESSGGVKKLESYIMENSKDYWKIYNRLHARIRICLASTNELNNLKNSNIKLYKIFCDNNIGIGGIRIYNKVQVKCIHLQIASFISLGFHPGQEWFDLDLRYFAHSTIQACNRRT